MSKKSIILSTLLSCSILISSFAEGDQSIASLTKKAKKELEVEHYHNASEYLKQIVLEDQANAWAHYELGISYLHTYSFAEALLHIEKAYTLDHENGVDKEYHYWLGRAHHVNYNFEEAIHEYNLYEERFKAHDHRRDEIEHFKSQALIAQKEFNDPKNYLILNLSNQVNTEFDEHSPVSANDGNTIYFTTKKLYQGHDSQDGSGEYYETIFETSRNEAGVWSVPQVVGGALDHPNAHDATIQVFDHDNKMLIHSEEGHGDIYIAERDVKGNWVSAKPLTQVNTKHLEEDATISSDGKMIIYSSVSGGKEYDLDLYVTNELEDGTWTEGKKLPGRINTIYEEESPFLSRDGKTLYFASNGPTSMGGYDIFKSALQADGTWGKPENMGFPINSAYHDIYYQLNSSETMAFYSSHREGGQGELDIYAIYPVQMVQIDGDLNTKAIDGPTDDMHVYFNSVGENQLDYSTDAAISVDGTFSEHLVSNNTYNVIITNGSDTLVKEHLIVDKTLDKGKRQDYTLFYDHPEDSLIADSTALASAEPVKEKIPEEGVKMALTSDQIIDYLKKGFGVSLVLFDYNKHELRTDSRQILERLNKELAKNSDIKIILTGHTDSVGSENYNKALSLKRARTASSFLEQMGVAKNRIATQGKGESTPVASNDTEEGRLKNRRVEIQFQTN